MERLVTTQQAAEILGISLQGVHYRIKKNQLKSIKQSGKTFVYVTDEMNSSQVERHKEQIEQQSSQLEMVIELKDEQISLLKKSVKWMRKQHKEEIDRLENNHNKMIKVFNSEIKLLQSAFNEMRSIYKPELEHRESKHKYISLEDFTLFMRSHKKSDKEIKIAILRAIQKRDRRFLFNKETRKVLILNEDFSDLI